jgi:hypothetical protein
MVRDAMRRCSFLEGIPENRALKNCDIAIINLLPRETSNRRFKKPKNYLTARSGKSKPF